MTTIDDAESGRVDNKAGKGDHRHIDNREEPYLFTDPDMLVAEF